MKPRRADAVVIAIASEIITGHFPAGSVLPAEQVLGERFDVSRTVVREALARLAGVGLIEVRHGLGSVVQERTRWREIDADLLKIRTEAGLIDNLLPDLFDIRRMVELEVAERAARQRTPEDLAILREIMEQQRASLGEPETFTAADIAFHDALFGASGNQLLRVLIAPISQVWRSGSMVTMRRDPEVVAYSLQGHEEIFAAIEAGDPVAARAAMNRHLDRFEQRLELALQLVESHKGGDGQGRSAALANEQQTR